MENLSENAKDEEKSWVFGGDQAHWRIKKETAKISNLMYSTHVFLFSFAFSDTLPLQVYAKCSDIACLCVAVAFSWGQLPMMVNSEVEPSL